MKSDVPAAASAEESDCGFVCAIYDDWRVEGIALDKPVAGEALLVAY